MGSACFAGLLDLVGVAAVKRVVFRNDSRNFHVGYLLFGDDPGHIFRHSLIPREDFSFFALF